MKRAPSRFREKQATLVRRLLVGTLVGSAVVVAVTVVGGIVAFWWIVLTR